MSAKEPLKYMSAQGKRYQDSEHEQFFFPGKSEGQPYKHDQFRYCYHFFKRMGKRGPGGDVGDKFDYFLFKADQNINHYAPKFMPELRAATLGSDVNPYNPHGLNSEFKVNILDEHPFYQMRDQIKSEIGNTKKIPLDNEMIVFEGCERDDKILLGGKFAFLSHFCTFFEFNVCHAAQETKMVQKGVNKFNDSKKLDGALEDLMASFNEKSE